MLRVGHLGRCLLLEPWFEEAGGGKGVSPAVLVHKGMVSWYGRCGCDVWVVVCRGCCCCGCWGARERARDRSLVETPRAVEISSLSWRVFRVFSRFAIAIYFKLKCSIQ
jgi:hypothetical protein